ncbi:MAG: hypothetical protein HY236_02890 [Acidobacteria bacterium]|nr:hypothetical protein [Acidobacteriota bacterium]
MASHVRILGALHIVFGALGIMAGVLVLLFFGGLAGVIGMTDTSGDARLAIPILGGIGGIIFIIALVLSLPSLIAGIGLLKFRSWARVLTIILSVLDLFHVPFGTALGFYGLWVLLSRETEQLFVRWPGQPARVL